MSDESSATLRQNANGNGAHPPPEPSEPLLSPIAQEVQRHIKDFEAKLGELKDDRAALVSTHEQALAAIDSDIGIVEGAIAGLSGRPAPALKALKPKKRQPRRVGRATSGGTATGFGISLEGAVEAADEIKRLIDEKVAKGEPATFIQKEFYRRPNLDWDQGKGAAAVRFLREIGFLRRAGRSPNTKADLWAIMDAAAVENAVKEVEAASDKHQHALFADPDQDPRQRVIKCLREVGEPVESFVTLAQLTGVTKYNLGLAVEALEQDNVIRVERRGSGKSVSITLCAEPEGATEA